MYIAPKRKVQLLPLAEQTQQKMLSMDATKVSHHSQLAKMELLSGEKKAVSRGQAKVPAIRSHSKGPRKDFFISVHL